MPHNAMGERLKSVSTLAVIAIPLVILTWVYTRTPEGDRAVRGAGRSAASSLPECGEPKIGQALPNGPTGKLLRGLPSDNDRAFLMLQIGACASCAGEEVKAWREAAEERHYRLVILTVSEPGEIARFRAANNLGQTPVIADPNNEITAWTGRCFTPRAMIFDRRWRLQGIQKGAFPDLRDPFQDPGLRTVDERL